MKIINYLLHRKDQQSAPLWLCVATLCAALCGSGTARADVLVKYPFGILGWETTSEVNASPRFGYSPSNLIANVSATVISDPAGKVGLEISSAATTPTNAPFLRLDPQGNAANQANAVANNVYFQFAVSTAPGYVLTATNLSFNAARGGAGTPRGVVVRSSADNFAANLFALDLPTARPTYTPISIPLTSVNFQKTTNLTFRIYSYSAGAGSSVDYDDFVVSGSVVLLPPTPTNLVAVPGNAQVTLSWNAVTGATNYVLARSTSPGGPFSTVTTTAGTGYVDTGLINGTTYYYVVDEQSDLGESSFSLPVSALPLAPPLPPASLSSVNGDTMVTLSWSASATASAYYVKRSLTSGGPYVNVGTNASTSYIDTGLANDTTYYYVVSAVNVGGEGANSSEVSAIPSPGPTALVAVGGDQQVALSWNELPSASSYNIKRSLTMAGPYTLVASGVTSLNYLDQSLAKGTIYYYVVSGQLLTGESGNSAEAAAVTTLSAPANLVPTVVSNALSFRVNLAWADSEPAVTTFKVERSANGTDFSQIGTVSGGVLTYSDTTVSPSFTYYYRVRAASGLQNSGYSGVVAATIPTLAVYVNFAITTFATNYPGYVNDYSLAYGLRTNGMTYGWDADNTANSRERSSAISPDKRYDTFTHMQKQVPARYWEIALPVGAYYVHMVSGDPTALDSVFKLDAEGVLTMDGVPSAVNNAYWVEGSNTVAVLDGRLTISINPLTAGNTTNNAKINFIDIVSVTPQLPVITNQPAGLVVTENDTASFKVGVSGTSPFRYQWFRNGSALPGQTNATLTLADVNLAQSGDYSVTVSNFLGVAVSANASLTVNQDVIAPTVVSASGDPSYSHVFVNFSERVTSATATDPANYLVADSNGAPLPVSAVLLLSNGKTVELFTAPHTAGMIYTVTVNAVTDISAQANVIAPDSQVQFTAWVDTACMLFVETFTGIPNTDIASLTNSTKFINNTPDMVGYLTSFNYSPNLDNYGARISGFFVAPSNGVYRFYIRSDDASQLFMNTNAVSSTDPAGKVLVAREDSCCHAYGYTNISVSPDILMNASQRYYIEALVKEGGGGDYVQVAFREQGDPSIPPSPASSTPVGAEVAPGTFFTTLANPDIASLSVAINPLAPQVYENDVLTLSAVLTYTPSNYPACLQWQKFDGFNYVDIPGATGLTYALPQTGFDQDGSQFRVNVITPGASSSAEVTVGVIQDTTPPTIVSVGSLDGTVIGVRFSEPIAPESLNRLLNWYINGEDGDKLTISSIGWSADLKTAYLTNSVQLPGDFFTVKAQDLTDRSVGGNTAVDVRASGLIEHLVSQDVGVPGVDPLNPGRTIVCSSNVFNVTAGGSDVWGTSNAMQFIYTQLTSDFDVRVRVQSLDPVNANSKAGLLATESLDPGSRNVNLVVTPPAVPITYSPSLLGANNYQANYRATNNGVSTQWPVGGRQAGVPYPNAWLRLSRSGNTFVAYYGNNGSDWSAFATNTVTPAYASPLYVGMAVTSHDNTNGHTVNAVLSDWYIVPAPGIVTQPQSLMLSTDQTATFSVAASGVEQGGPLVYQWRFNGVNIANETGPTLTIQHVQAANVGSYDVVVRNTGGTITSAVATLTVADVPAFTQQPSDTTVNCRGDATFTAVASGTAPLVYQWYFDSTTKLVGETNATLSLTNVSLAQAGAYSVTVSNAAGTVSSSSATLTVTDTLPPVVALNGFAEITVQCHGTFVEPGATANDLCAGSLAVTITGSVDVNVPGNYVLTYAATDPSGNSASVTRTVHVVEDAPLFTTQPQNQTNGTGTAATFVSAVTSCSSASYQWYFAGNPLPGQTAATLTLANVQFANAGNYFVVASNSSGFTTSSVAVLTVVFQSQNLLSVDINLRTADTPASTMPGFSNFVIGAVGGTAAKQTNATVRNYGPYTVTLTGNGVDPGYIDRQRGTPVNAGAFTQAELLKDLIFSQGTDADAGLNVALAGFSPNQVYDVTIWSFDTGSSGNRVSDWTANGILVKDNWTFNGTTLPTNDLQYQFTFQVIASPSGQITVQGRRDSSTGANNPGVFLNGFRVATGLPQPPVIAQQPVGTTLYAGDSTLLSTVVGAGIRPLSYQWLKSGSPITGATNATYGVVNAQATDQYSVVVTNVGGAVTSAVAQVTVVPVASLTTALVSDWPLATIGNTTPDIISGNDLAAVNMDSSNLAAGQCGRAAVFNGTDEALIHTNSVGLPIYAAPNFTVTFWVKGNGVGQSDRRIFAEGATNNNNPIFSLGTDNAGATNLLDVFIRNDGGSTPLNHKKSSLPVLDNQWHHVAWVDGNGFARLYVDGVLDTNDFTYTKGVLTAHTTSLGALARATNSNFFAGSIDNVIVWSRSLSAAEVVSVKNNGIVTTPVISCPPDVTVYADLDQSSKASVALGNPDLGENCNILNVSNNAPSSFPVGTTVVTWTVTDLNGHSTTCSQNVTVLPNHSPLAGNDGGATGTNTPLTFTTGTLLANDSDADGDALTFTSVSAVSTNGGTVALSGSTVTYTPVNNFNGVDRFTYTITDAHGNTATGIVEVAVVKGTVPPANSATLSSSGNSYQLRFSGVAGQSYEIKRATEASGPYVTIQTVVAPLSGLIEFTDPNPPASNAFYQLLKP